MEKNKFKIGAILFLVWIGSTSFAQVSFPTITVNLSYPQFQRLKLDQGFVYLEGSWKGIILFRQSENTYLAYERACPHHPNDPCGHVQVDGSSLFMICHCCRSSFNFADGQPMGGPAQRPLIQYRVDMDGSTLKISDEIIN